MHPALTSIPLIARIARFSSLNTVLFKFAATRNQVFRNTALNYSLEHIASELPRIGHRLTSFINHKLLAAPSTADMAAILSTVLHAIILHRATDDEGGGPRFFGSFVTKGISCDKAGNLPVHRIALARNRENRRKKCDNNNDDDDDAHQHQNGAEVYEALVDTVKQFLASEYFQQIARVSTRTDDELRSSLLRSVSPLCQNKRGETALELAARGGNVALFRRMLDEITGPSADPHQHQVLQDMLMRPRPLRPGSYKLRRINDELTRDECLPVLLCDVDPKRVPAASTFAILEALLSNPVANPKKLPLTEFLDYFGRTALYFAVERRNVELVRLLVRRRPPPPGSSNSSTQLPLLYFPASEFTQRSPRTGAGRINMFHQVALAQDHSLLNIDATLEMLGVPEVRAAISPHGGAVGRDLWSKGQDPFSGSRHGAPIHILVRRFIRRGMPSYEERAVDGTWPLQALLRFFLRHGGNENTSAAASTATTVAPVNQQTAYRSTRNTPLHICVFMWLHAHCAGVAAEQEAAEEAIKMLFVETTQQQQRADYTIRDYLTNREGMTPMDAALSFQPFQIVSSANQRFRSSPAAYSRCAYSWSAVPLVGLLHGTFGVPLPSVGRCLATPGETVLHRAASFSSDNAQLIIQNSLRPNSAGDDQRRQLLEVLCRSGPQFADSPVPAPIFYALGSAPPRIVSTTTANATANSTAAANAEKRAAHHGAAFSAYFRSDGEADLQGEQLGVVRLICQHGANAVDGQSILVMNSTGGSFVSPLAYLVMQLAGLTLDSKHKPRPVTVYTPHIIREILNTSNDKRFQLQSPVPLSQLVNRIPGSSSSSSNNGAAIREVIELLESAEKVL